MEPILFCPQCGSQNNSGKFCRRCGTNLVIVSEAISKSQPDHLASTYASGGSTIRVFSGANITNRGKDLNGHTTLALFGGIKIDLTAAPLPDGEIVLNVISIFGGTEIVVPEDVGLQITGITICGGFEISKEDASGGLFHENDYYEPDYEQMPQRIHIKATTLFGGFEVKRKPPNRW